MISCICVLTLEIENKVVNYYQFSGKTVKISEDKLENLKMKL